MTDHQVQLLSSAIAAGIPTFAVLLGFLSNNRSVDSLRREMESLHREMESLRREMAANFEAMKQGLLRVEGVLDARLKHVEEKIG